MTVRRANPSIPAMPAPAPRPVSPPPAQVPVRPASAGPLPHTNDAPRPHLVRPHSTGSLPNEKSISRVNRHLYAHGAFMGLTRSFLQNDAWRTLLAELTPDVFARVSALLATDSHLAGSHLATMMSVLENSPVLAAYGTCRSGRRSPPIEWDLWLDPDAPEDFDRARVVHGNRHASDIAEREAMEARHLVSRSVDDSDVHLGLSPQAWKAAYDAALDAMWPRRSRKKLAIYLDVKSTYSTSADINKFTHAVTRLGVDVRGVGSFKLTQLDSLAVKRKIHLFDLPHDVENAWKSGVLKPGAIAMFNGGGLLRSAGADRWEIDPVKFADLQATQQAGKLRLTVYIQETVASWQALDTVARCVNRSPAMFALGFAYGSVSGLAEGGVPHGDGVTMYYAPQVTVR